MNESRPILITDYHFDGNEEERHVKKTESRLRNLSRKESDNELPYVGKGSLILANPEYANIAEGTGVSDEEIVLFEKEQ